MTFDPPLEKPIFVGRDKEINELCSNFNDKKSITLLVGESGIGKSKLLDQIHTWLRHEYRDRFFIGYYDKSKALISESPSLIYPFSLVLASLIEEAKQSQQPDERIDNTLNRIQRTLIKFAKEEGKKMVEAIIEDVAKKTGLEQTLSVAKGFLKAWKSEKTSLMLAEDYVAEHKKDALESYLGIFRALSDEFKDRSFVLIFDQFESIGKSPIDFFLNLVKFLPDRFHVIVAFRTESGKWDDTTSKKLYEDARDKIINELGGKEKRLEGLSVEDIGRWIKISRGIQLPQVPHLQRIRENSGGLPLLLDRWIKESKDLMDYEEIKRDRICVQIIKQEEGLSDEDLVRIHKLAILVHPFSEEELASYLEIENIDFVIPFTKRLSDRGIFEEKSNWFRHELVQKCFEDNLSSEEKRRYHNRAADFYKSLREGKNERGTYKLIIANKGSYEISIAYAIHLHNAGRFEESYNENKALAEYALRKGDLDLAERSYKRAINDAEQLGHMSDRMICIRDMTRDVYVTWSRYDESLKNYRDLLDYFHRRGDKKGKALILNYIAIVHQIRGQYDEAIKLNEESLEIFRQLGDQDNTSLVLFMVGGIHQIRGQYDEALKSYEESLVIRRELGDKQGIAASSICAASMHQAKGQYDEAIKLHKESLEIFRQLGDQQSIATGLLLMASMYTGKRQYDEAIRLLEESLVIKKEFGDKQGRAGVLQSLAGTYQAKGQYDEAIKLHKESLEIFRQLGDQNNIAYILFVIGIMHQEKGQYDEALKSYEESLEMMRKLENQHGTAMNSFAIGTIHIKRKKHMEALPYTIEAYDIFKRLGLPDTKHVLDDLNDIRHSLGDEDYQKKLEEMARKN